MKDFAIGYKKYDCYNEIKYLMIDGKHYLPEDMSNELLDLLTAISYDESHEDSLEFYDNIAQMIGYDSVIKGIQELKELGHQVLPDFQIRKLIMNKNKNKYKGLMRNLFN